MRKKCIILLAAMLMALVSLAVTVAASETYLNEDHYENPFAYTVETYAVDIDSLLEELVLSNTGRHFCEDTDRFIYRLKRHQLSGEPLYVTTWRMYYHDDVAARNPWQVPFARVQAVRWNSFEVGWIVENTTRNPLNVTMNGRLYSGVNPNFIQRDNSWRAVIDLDANRWVSMDLVSRTWCWVTHQWFVVAWTRTNLDVWLGSHFHSFIAGPTTAL